MTGATMSGGPATGFAPLGQTRSELEIWLLDADAVLTQWDPTRSDELDDIVERGLSLSDAADELLSARDRARLSVVLARVVSGLAVRRDEVLTEIDGLHRQRQQVTRNATGVAGYITATESI